MGQEGDQVLMQNRGIKNTRLPLALLRKAKLAFLPRRRHMGAWATAVECTCCGARGPLTVPDEDEASSRPSLSQHPLYVMPIQNFCALLPGCFRKIYSIA